MINFFRKTRKKLADDNKPLKYARYAIGEIVLVMVGILLALQVNNWNENRKERKQEYDYLQLISSDIRLDNEQLNTAVLFIESKMKSLKIIHEVIEGGRERTDSIKWAVNESPSLGWTLSFERPSMATYDEMISSGNLKLIDKAQLRNSIIEYYSFWNHQVERTHQRRSNYPNLSYKLFDLNNLPESASEIREILKTKNVEIEFENEFKHEVNYGRFILESVLPYLIEKNKEMGLLIKEENYED